VASSSLTIRDSASVPVPIGVPLMACACQCRSRAVACQAGVVTASAFTSPESS
jgi:hypothetical protein